MNGPLSHIQSRLSGLRSTLRALFAADWLGRFLLLAFAFVAVTFLADYLMDLPVAIRLILLAAGLGYLGYFTVRRLFRPMALRITDDDLALLVERENPELNDRLISAIQLQRAQGRHPDFNSPELIDALVSEAAESSRNASFDGVINRKPVAATFGLGIAAAVLLGGLSWAAPAYASTYIERLVGFETKWPQITFFKVEGFDDSRERVIARGDDLEIRTLIDGVIPSRVYIEYEFASGEEGRPRMHRRDVDRFEYFFEEVLEEFEFRIVAHNVVSDTFTVRILPPPTIEDPRLFFAFPGYLKESYVDTPPDQPVHEPNTRVPMHTGVRLRTQADADLEHAELLVGTGKDETIRDVRILPDEQGRPRVIEGSFAVDRKNLEYSIRARARNKLWNRNPLRYTIKGEPDQAPVIQVIRPRIAIEEVTRECRKQILLKVRDDHGIAAIRMQYRVVRDSDPEWEEKRFGKEELVPPQYGGTPITVTDVLDLRELATAIGDTVEVKFLAEDYKNIEGPNVTTTPSIYLFRVIPLSELEKKLEQEISRIKDEMRKLRRDQSRFLGRTDWLRNKYREKEGLARAEAAEIRQVSLEQNSITDRLGRLQRDVIYIRERGLENLIFDERSAGALQRVVDLMDGLVSEKSQPPGLSYEAAQALQNAWRQDRPDIRDTQFSTARSRQSDCIEVLDVIIQTLDLWSTYQEVVRMAREVYEAQKDARKRIEERRLCPRCRKGEGCPVHRPRER